MSWPALRTEPVRWSAIGGPIGAGCAFVLVVAPLVASSVLIVVNAVVEILGGSRSTAGRAVMEMVVMVAASPFVSWAALPLVAPVAWIAGRIGWAGWAVAVGAGGCLGGLVSLALEGADPRPIFKIQSVMVGVILAGAFWIGAKVAAGDNLGTRHAQHPR